jgi:hypothetical protein
MNFIKNIKIRYWIFGNFITLISSLFCLLLLFLSDHHVLGYTLFYFIILLPPFLSGFLIKFIRQDLSIYYYGTVGLAYQMVFLSIGCYFNDEPIKFLDFLLNLKNILILTLIVSIIGGIMSILVNKLENKKKIIN